MMPTLKIGVIGCGQIAQQVHIPILCRMPEAELAALADIEPANLRQAQRAAPGAKTYIDYRDLLAQPDIDATIVATSTGTHAATAVAAFECNKHVYLEKPLATSLQEANDVLKAWKVCGKTGMIGFNYRFSQAYQALRHRLQAGQLGTLVGARSVFNSGESNLPAWKTRRDSGGGVLLDLASHHIDLVRYLFGEIRRVFAHVQSIRSQADTATLQLELENGLSVQSFFSSCSTAEQWLEVYGREGKWRARPYDRTDVERTKSMQTGLWRQGFHTLMGRLREQPLRASYGAAMRHFVSCARDSRPCSPDLIDGYRSLAAIEAAEESARTGQAVCLPQTAEICVQPL